MSPAASGQRPRARFAAAPVARLASIRPDGSPHLVPVTFALLPDAGNVGGDARIVFAVDAKPKSTIHLQRLANIAAEPRVSFLVDRYDDEWSELWWVRADGRARVLDEATEMDAIGTALDALAAKYPQYRGARPAGPVVSTVVTRWVEWAYRPRGGP